MFLPTSSDNATPYGKRSVSKPVPGEETSDPYEHYVFRRTEPHSEEAGPGHYVSRSADVYDVNRAGMHDLLSHGRAGQPPPSTSISGGGANGIPAVAEVHSTSNRADAGPSTSAGRKMRLVADAPGLDLNARSSRLAIYDRRDSPWNQFRFYLRWTTRIQPSLRLDVANVDVGSLDVSDAHNVVLSFPYKLVSFDSDWKSSRHTICFRDQDTQVDIRIVFDALRDYVLEEAEDLNGCLEVDYMAVFSWIGRFSMEDQKRIYRRLNLIPTQLMISQMISSSSFGFDTRRISAGLRLVKIDLGPTRAGFTLLNTGYAT